MEPWYKQVTPRKEVREGRSFNPDEFAIALEQVVAGSAPDDYKKPEQFFLPLEGLEQFSQTPDIRELRHADNSGGAFYIDLPAVLLFNNRVQNIEHLAH